MLHSTEQLVPGGLLQTNREDRNLQCYSDSQVLDMLKRHGAHPSAFLATNSETLRYSMSPLDGLIAYRVAGKYLITACGIMAAPEDKEALLRSFLEMAAREQRRVIALQVLREDAQILARHGFTVNQLGCSYCLKLERFTLKGTRFIRLRNKISRARRSDVQVYEVSVDRACDRDLYDKVRRIDAAWLKSKGARKKELAFLIGELGDLVSLDRQYKRLFVAEIANEIVGYILYTPSYGTYSGWMHDLTRRLPSAPPGVMELINYTALERFQAEGAGYLNFGFTPLTELDQVHEIQGAYSACAARVLNLLSRYGAFIYPAQSQVQYKLKWYPDVVLPEHIAFQGGFTLTALWAVLRVTRAI